MPNTPRLVELQTLRRNQRFTLPASRHGGGTIAGKLIEKGAGSATVEIERHTERTFQTRTGKVVRIRKHHDRGQWALTTIVEVGGKRS